ncbi:kinase binding protein CGI-121, putative [Bodo saltans]|uniref:Kinase binding protein CGI-121, putative n=1 Tax=Bodo saltans TaxID=75058 RepID=A0A0S4JLS7_BODSA|nr:kinase binding protein CGI-121, putative [Bodo saltans]|eukprot:CUG91139.1 kinase binding protein CGI-121, putative [Bodo saltans]
MSLTMERMGEWVVLAFHSISNLDELLSDVKLLSLCGVMNGSLICSRLQLAVAMQRLSNHLAVSGGQLRSRTMASELMLMLSPTRNITEALRLFSVDPSSSALSSSSSSGRISIGDASSTSSPSSAAVVVLALHNPQREDIGYVVERVEGAAFPLSELLAHADATAIAKVYGIGAAELQHCGLEASVVNRIAIADI